MDNSMVVDSDSRSTGRKVCYSTEFEQHNNVNFISRKFGKMYPEEEKTM